MTDFSLAVIHESCIQCRRCVQVCPAGIFAQEEKGKKITTQNVGSCIFCGHCVAVCPTASVEQSVFPPDKVHNINRESLPSPDAVELLMRARRSNRGFSKKPVPQEYLDRIMEAAHRAPTASNLQQVSYVCITDPKILRQIADYAIDGFTQAIKSLKNPILKPMLKLVMPDNYRMIPRLENIIQKHKNGDDPILRHATALIFIYTPEKNMFGRDDANLAYQNASLMAESLGVSQFYTGFVCNAIRRDKKNKLAGLLGIEGAIQAGIALGMPDFLFPKYIDKKEISVKKL